MSCYICGRGNCMPSFHSCEEQQAYERAEEAYDRYLDVREECRIAYQEGEDEEEDV